jgi:hypothetical protein
MPNKLYQYRALWGVHSEFIWLLSVAPVGRCQRITQWVRRVGDKLPELLEMGGKKLFNCSSAISYDLVACAPTAYRNRRT